MKNQKELGWGCRKSYCLLKWVGNFILVELQPRQILLHSQSSSKSEMQLLVKQEGAQSCCSVSHLFQSCHCSSRVIVEVQQPVIAWENKPKEIPLILSCRHLDPRGILQGYVIKLRSSTIPVTELQAQKWTVLIICDSHCNSALCFPLSKLSNSSSPVPVFCYAA